MSVELVLKHEGFLGEINDNMLFLNKIDLLERSSSDKQKIEEHFNNYINVYILDKKYVYFTVEHDFKNIDGYIISGDNWEELFEFVSEKRNNYSNLKEELLEICKI